MASLSIKKISSIYQPTLPGEWPAAAQHSDGYRFSNEPFLLADFVRPRHGDRVLDVGSGSGVVPILLATRFPGLKITGVEIQKSLLDIARQNVRENGLENLIHLVHADFTQALPALDNEPFDLILGNPPHRKLGTGRINPDPGKAMARHELTLNLPGLIESAHARLKSGGKLALVYPLSRLEEARKEMLRRKIYPSRLRLVCGRTGKPPYVFLIEGIKGAQVPSVAESTLSIYNEAGIQTEEMKDLYASFNHPGWTHRL